MVGGNETKKEFVYIKVRSNLNEVPFSSVSNEFSDIRFKTLIYKNRQIGEQNIKYYIFHYVTRLC